MDLNDEWSGDCVAISAQRFTPEEAAKIAAKRLGTQYVKIFKSLVKQVGDKNSDLWEYGVYVEGKRSVPVWIIVPMSANPQIWIKQENIWDEKEVYVVNNSPLSTIGV